MKIIGIYTETTNENEQAAKDLGELWQRFYREGVSAKIPNKQSDEIYSIYTDYETDYRGKYKTIIGHIVTSIDAVPEGLIGREFPNEKYEKFVAKGEMPGAVVQTWKRIWDGDESLNRTYTADFEVHGEKSQNGADSEVEIYIAVEK